MRAQSWYSPIMAGAETGRLMPARDEVEEQADLPLGDGEWLMETAEEPESPRRWREKTLLAALLLAACAWIGAVVLVVASAAPAGGLDMARAAAWVGVACGPLTLLGLLAILLFRTGRAEAILYARAARDLRTESHRLAELLTLVDRRIASARHGLVLHGSELVRIGEETSDRLGRAGEALRGDATLLAETAAKLDDATATARTDLGVLLTDLPGLEERARKLSDHLRAIGGDAEAQGAALLAALAGVEAQAKAADQSSVAAARRLAIELERIEGSAAAADRRIVEAAAKLGTTADEALDHAATGLDAIRRGISDQGAALTALVVQSRDLIGHSGEEASRQLGARLDDLARRIAEASGRIEGHEAAARGLLVQLDRALDGIEARFEGLGDKGAEHVADLAETLATLADHGEQIGRVLGENGDTAQAVLTRIERLRADIERAGTALDETIPAAFARLRAEADATLGRLDTAGPRADALIASAEALKARLLETEALLGRGGETIATLVTSADDGFEALRSRVAGLDALVAETVATLATGADNRFEALKGRVAALDALAAETDRHIAELTEGASVRLVDALLRVRETAQSAAAHAREALASAVPEAAAQLGQAGAEAMARALEGVGRDEIEAVRAASTEAADAAAAAAERLNRQLLTLTETTRAVEARIAEHQTAATDSDEQSFARQVSLLIEALNSTAIDVAKIFSNEPTDAEWAAYLKGDRGVFTRRAVRLIDAADARAIATRYNEDAEFRGQVTRYIHDFEAMLRRVLAVREGSAMGVTMLSSDMGKLYVALAQAIERLRR